MGGGMDKKDPKIIVVDYFCDLQWGVCQGPAKLLEILVKDKTLF